MVVLPKARTAAVSFADARLGVLFDDVGSTVGRCGAGP
jgi:hypothetical protein